MIHVGDRTPRRTEDTVICGLLRWRQARDRSRRDRPRAPTGFGQVQPVAAIEKSWRRGAVFGVKRLNIEGEREREAHVPIFRRSL